MPSDFRLHIRQAMQASWNDWNNLEGRFWNIFGGKKIPNNQHLGGFLKWWYPQSPPQVLIIFSRKTHGFVGETHHLRKHLFWEVRCACCKIQLSRLADPYWTNIIVFLFKTRLWVDGVLGFKCSCVSLPGIFFVEARPSKHEISGFAFCSGYFSGSTWESTGILRSFIKTNQQINTFG